MPWPKGASAIAAIICVTVGASSVHALERSKAEGDGEGDARRKTIMIIRHAEKPPHGDQAPQGVDETGARDSHSLIVRGWTRAGALIGLFDPPHGNFANRHLVRPETIYAPRVWEKYKSKRSLQTVTPLADRLGKKPNNNYSVGEEEKLAKALKSEESSNILVAWEHHKIKEIVGHFLKNPPREWPDDRFDLVWVLKRTYGDRWSFHEVPQRLLAGDEDSAARTDADDRHSTDTERAARKRRDAKAS